MSNQEKLTKLLTKTSQPVIIVAPDEFLWQEICNDLTSQFKITVSDIIYFQTEEGVKELRKKINLLNIKPHSSRYRFFLVFNIDKMNKEQINTLLKTLEEPPEYGRIILFASSSSRILPTVKSRCQKVFIADKKTNQDLSLLGFFTKNDFNGFLKELKDKENNELYQLLEGTIEELKNKMLNEDEVELYKKLLNNLIRFSSTNVNRKLRLEAVFVWWKSTKEK